MAALGEIEPIDAAIHADTTHERGGTYEFAARWTPWLESRGVRVVTVQAKSTDPVDNGYGWPDEPFYTVTEAGKGQIKRQCTSHWKIKPIRQWLHANRNGENVEQWIGISLDEALRMKPADVKYITHRWPLIEKRMTRHDCKRWLEAHGIEVPPRSSCVFCPYHNAAAWSALKSSGNGDWSKAVEVDKAIRKARPPYDLFVHPARIPLEEVDLRTPQERGQLELWNEECSGYCGV